MGPSPGARFLLQEEAGRARASCFGDWSVLSILGIKRHMGASWMAFVPSLFCVSCFKGNEKAPNRRRQPPPPPGDGGTRPLGRVSKEPGSHPNVGFCLVSHTEMMEASYAQVAKNVCGRPKSLKTLCPGSGAFFPAQTTVRLTLRILFEV